MELKAADTTFLVESQPAHPTLQAMVVDAEHVVYAKRTPVLQVKGEPNYIRVIEQTPVRVEKIPLYDLVIGPPPTPGKARVFDRWVLVEGKVHEPALPDVLGSWRDPLGATHAPTEA